LWHTGLFVRRPCTVIGVFGLVFLAFLGAAMAGKIYELSPAHDREYLVWDDIRTVQLDSLIQAEEDVQRSSSDEAKPIRSQSMSYWTFSLIYECDGCDNVFTPEKLRDIKA